MSALNYVLCFAAALLGMGIYLFCMKIPETLQKAKVANHPMDLVGYFKTDQVALIGSLMAIFLFLLWADELIHFYPPIKPMLKIMYGSFGYMGSTAIIAILGKASACINKVIDIKTDIADGKRPAADNPTTP